MVGMITPVGDFPEINYPRYVVNSDLTAGFLDIFLFGSPLGS
jgi:hypothetical protein